jgi:hypothetical protein
MTTYYGLGLGEEYKPWWWPVPEDGVIGKRGLRLLMGPEKARRESVFTLEIRPSRDLLAKSETSPYAHAKI